MNTSDTNYNGGFGDNSGANYPNSQGQTNKIKFCHKCGCKLEGSVTFCTRCGTEIVDRRAHNPETSAPEMPVAETPVEETSAPEMPVDETPAEETSAPEMPVAEAPAPETQVLPTNDSDTNTDCYDANIHTNTKSKNSVSFLIVSAILGILLVASVIVNVVQYGSSKEFNELISSQKSTISSQKKTISSQKKTISSQKKTISSQNLKISDLEETSDYYNTICNEMTSSNMGYAAENFRAAESVIVVRKSDKSRKLRLTAHWPQGGTVGINYSGYSASLDFDDKSWSTSTTLTVKPNCEGVTVAEFNNTKDSKKFKVIIIVTD